MKKITLILTTTLMIAACASTEVQDTSQPAVSDASQTMASGSYTDNNQTTDADSGTNIKHTSWACSDYITDNGAVLRLAKSNITIGDVMQKAIDSAVEGDEEISKKVQESKDINESLENLQAYRVGYIQFEDGEKVGAIYMRRGINHRWEWEDKYIFEIKPDGTGLYYDSTNTKKGELIRPRDMFKCEKQ